MDHQPANIPWDQRVQLNDKDRGRLLDLSLAQAVDEAATFDPARLAIAEIRCDPPISIADGPRSALNADSIALLIQQRRKQADSSRRGSEANVALSGRGST